MLAINSALAHLQGRSRFRFENTVLHIGVETPTHFYCPATIISRTGPVIDVAITVPRNQPVSSWFFSNSVVIKDSTGTMAQSSAITPPAGLTDHNITLTVSK